MVLVEEIIFTSVCSIHDTLGEHRESDLVLEKMV